MGSTPLPGDHHSPNDGSRASQERDAASSYVSGKEGSFSIGSTPWLLGMSLVLFLALLPFSSYVTALPFIRVEWALSNSQAGLIFTIYLVGYPLSALLVIPLTDRFPAHRILLIGLAIMAGGNLLFPILAHGLGTALMLRFLAGAGQVSLYMPSIRLISDHYGDQRRGTAIGIFVAAGYAGTTLSYTVTGLLFAGGNDWRTAYLLVASAALLSLVFAFLLTRMLPPESEPASPTRRRGGRLDLRILGDQAIVLTIVAYALHTAELYLARLWFPLLLGSLFMGIGMSAVAATSRAATLAGFMFMTGIAGVFVGGYLSDRLGRTRGGILVFTVSGLCSLLAGRLLGAPPVFLIALGFVYGLATAADSAIYLAAAIELAPSRQVGSVQAVQSFVGFTLGALVPVLAGSILDAVHGAWGWTLAFSFNALLAFLGVLALNRLRRLSQAAKLAMGRH